MIDGSSKRVGTEHEETIVGDVPHCRICGRVDRQNEQQPDPEFHPEIFDLDELAEHDVIELIPCKFCNHNAGPDYHLHRGRAVCDDCWDDRLKSTE